MSEESKPDMDDLDGWLKYLNAAHPGAPLPDSRAGEQKDLLKPLSRILPQTTTGLQCLTLAKILDRDVEWSRERADLVESALHRAWKLGKEKKVEQEWEIEWWVRAVANYCHSLPAQDRLIRLMGFGRAEKEMEAERGFEGLTWPQDLDQP